MRRYTREVKDFIATNVKSRSAKALAEFVNAEYATDFTEASMKSYKKNNKLKSETPRGNPAGFSILYPPEVQAFMRDNVAGKTTKELADYTNSTFATSYSEAQIKTYKNNHDLRSGLYFQFPKGHVPANKGLKGYHAPGSEKGWFQKGHSPLNSNPVGTETLRDDGYLWVKIAEPNKWKQRHRILWEKANGKVHRGFCLLFSDGDRKNTSLDNLILISRSQLAVLNKLNLIQNERALTETGIKIADIHMKMYQRKNPNIKKPKQQT